MHGCLFNSTDQKEGPKFQNLFVRVEPRILKGRIQLNFLQKGFNHGHLFRAICVGNKQNLGGGGGGGGGWICPCYVWARSPECLVGYYMGHSMSNQHKKWTTPLKFGETNAYTE